MVEKSSLFSFEVAVKTIFLKRAIVCRVPIVSARLLDYPTLEFNLITDDELKKVKTFVQNDPTSAMRSPQILELQHSTGTYSFTQGKSFLIETKLSELKENLCNIPVYVMVMDVLPTVPKLVASFALSMDNVIGKIVRDVSLNGIEIPAAHGERDIYPLYNLMGNKVGEAEMGVRFTSLGIMMLQHVSDIVQPENLNDSISNANDKILHPPKEEHYKPSLAEKISSSAQTTSKMIVKDVSHESNKENIASHKNGTEKTTGSTQTVKHQTSSKYVQFPIKPVIETLGSTENIFCPPALYYDKTSDVAERKLFKKQQNAIAHRMQKVDETLSMSDLENEEKDKIIVPSSILYQSPTPNTQRFVSSNTTQTNSNVGMSGIASKLEEFPILRALVEEVARLGFQGTEQVSSPIAEKLDIFKSKEKVESKPLATKAPKSLRKPVKNQSEQKQLLRFGLTNTMRLRMAMTKADKRQQKETVSATHLKHTTKGTKQSTLGRTFVKSYPVQDKRKVKMVTTACGPDNSMYRRGPPGNVNQQTVYLGRMNGYEEATDLDVPSMGHMISDSQFNHDAHSMEDDDNIEDLMIVKDIRTPRAHSRQSQRSIEIHLPTASTEFTIGRDDDGEWESTVSDKEKLQEAIRKARELEYEEEPEFYTPPESTDTSRPQSSADIRSEKKITQNDDNVPQSEVSASDNYKYSDDFEDDKTWSANRTPSAITPINSVTVIKEEDEETESEEKKPIPPFPSKSMDSTITTTRTSDFTDSFGEEAIIRQIGELRSASAQKISSSDDAIDTSSVSKGSIVTALMGTRRRTEDMKVGNITVPGPIPSDSPVIQSIQSTESGTMSAEQFPVPKKHSLTSKSSGRHKKTTSKAVTRLPKTIKDTMISSSKVYKNPPPNPKYSRTTPSPPSTRRPSPLSSPESSKDRLRRMFHHPGRRTRPTSSGSGSSDFEKPVSPVRRSDSVSSYQPSEMSDVKLSEDLENLSDILSEEPDSQNGRNHFHSSYDDDDVPSDLPKTYFGRPKLDPNTKLGYTT